MIEEKVEKTQQVEQEALQMPEKHGQKLRSLWARIQCMRVRQTHRIRRTTRHHVSSLRQKLLSNRLARSIGGALYALGFGTEYVLVRFGRGAKALALLIVRQGKKLLGDLMATAFPGAALVLKELFGPIYVFGRGMRNLHVYHRQLRKEKGLARALWQDLCYLGRGMLRYAGLLPRTAMYILPLCALALLVTVIRTTISRPYTLAVHVNGETVGYVENEEVFDAAREAVRERISYAGTSETEWTIEPTYTLAIAGDVMNENEMVDTILRSASDEISEGTALYLDGELTAVCSDGSKLRSYLSSLVAPLEEPDNPDMRVSFNREVVLEDGLYFNESFQSYNDVVTLLSGVQQAEKIYTVVAGDSISLIASKNGLTVKELCALNTDISLDITSAIFPGDELIVTKEEALLEVRVTRTVTWQEEIPFATEKSTSSEYAFGTTRTVQEGQAGIRSITAENVYDADGVLLEQKILSSEVIKEPVNQKIVTGTKLPSGSIAQVGNGTFIWPVPKYTYCSRWYSSGHKGVDICAPAGTPIYASASGVISKAGYEKAGAGTGYGYSVIINHGNGYQTVYAHCLSLTVSAGQSVKQGQLIGYVGSTGRSSGNHCHFEIIYNGKYLPPQNYFTGK